MQKFDIFSEQPIIIPVCDKNKTILVSDMAVCDKNKTILMSNTTSHIGLAHSVSPI